MSAPDPRPPSAAPDGPAALVAAARSQSLGDLPRRTARRCGGRTAIVDGEVSMTFRELADRVDATAAALTAAGLGKGDRLALVSHNCWQYAVLVFATARVGIVLVPVNFMLNAAEIAYILTTARAAALVVEDVLVPTADEAVTIADREGHRVAVRAVIGPRGRDVSATGWPDAQPWFDHDGVPPEVVVADDDPIRMMFTSGTESRPKGALLTSRSLLWQYVSCAVDGEMSADDVELHTLPLYHCAQLDVFLGVDVYLGATSVILPGPDPVAVLAAIAEHRITKFFAPPTVWISLLRSPGLDDADTSSLAKGYYGASPMPVEVLEELQQRLPDVRLWNLYGQTEMAPLAAVLKPHEQLARAGSAGRVALNVETRIVTDDDTDVAPGEVGEIVHRSPHATVGYFEDDERTAEAFRNGWFHSGDLGYADDDGYLYVVDRKKDMIETGAENVASREVEEALYAMPGVAEVAVFGIPHPRWVEAVAAVVVPQAGAELTGAAVIAHARGVLAGFKTPKYVVVADCLPKNPSGKILKRDLRQQHAGLAADDG